MTDSKRRQRVVVVIGPGRSGTSALTRAVAALGIDLGDHLKPPSPKNPKGFFEDLDILDLNYRLHDAMGLRRNGSSARVLTADEWKAADLEPFRAELAEIVERRFADSPHWGFKCGGVLRMLPFWEETLEALGHEVQYVYALRNPIDVARSRMKLDVYRGRQEKCDAEWLIQAVPYLRRVASRPCVVVDYDRMMEDPRRELHRMARHLDVELDEAVEAGIEEYASEFLSGGLQHNRAGREAVDSDLRLNPLARDAYRWLYALACDDVSADDPELQQDWRRIEEGLAALAPLLQHVDFLEDELRGRGFGLHALLQTKLHQWGLREVR